MTPGRTCPTGYRYGADSLARLHSHSTAALYVVGGLYGNLAALGAVLAQFEREPEADKRLVFNGDFHWFDIQPAIFEAVTAGVLRHDALRGNVETELANGAGDVGCGCGYPEWVEQGVVSRSNSIIERLAVTAAMLPAQRERISALPMALRYQVGAARVAVVHGDAESLAGWGFSQEHLGAPEHLATVNGWFERADVDLFACTHTCLPILRQSAPGRWIANNGAAGMPNFSRTHYGILTRIATTPFVGSGRLYGVVSGGVHIDAIALDYDTDAFTAQFLEAWPPGSAAHRSYWSRIAHGPQYAPAQAFHGDTPTPSASVEC